MAIPVPLETGLTGDRILEAFNRALNDMTDEQINSKLTEITEKIAEIETRLTVLESTTTE
ncbi:MAG: hypothetical protein K2I06_14205 [Ruminococcus sp.]|nr:hypothetical protein [Ruminococcus sp.]